MSETYQTDSAMSILFATGSDPVAALRALADALVVTGQGDDVIGLTYQIHLDEPQVVFQAGALIEVLP